ncbi:MAG TPA: hypothetical protein VIQ74_12975, partial [Gemmatimonadaceae bacterium]
MKRKDLLPFVLLLPVLGFVAVQAVQSPRLTATTQSAILAASRMSSAGRIDADRATDRASAEGRLAATPAVATAG